MDVTALLVLGTLAVAGLVTPRDALGGFSNAAVVTVWAMFILSEGLTRAGVANVIGRHVLRAAGRSETRLVFVVMLGSGTLSAFMNNIGVAALMLPVVIDVARKTGCPPSRLLMPLAYGTLLGVLTTLIGTPPNLLVSDALRQQGLAPFRLIDFTPVGFLAVLAGTAFVAFAGRRLLPRLDPGTSARAGRGHDLKKQYALGDRIFVMRVGPDSRMIGITLGRSRLGAALGLNILAIVRRGETRLGPPADTVLEANDRLIAQGRLDRLESLRGWQEFAFDPKSGDPAHLVDDDSGGGRGGRQTHHPWHAGKPAHSSRFAGTRDRERNRA